MVCESVVRVAYSSGLANLAAALSNWSAFAHGDPSWAASAVPAVQDSQGAIAVSVHHQRVRPGRFELSARGTKPFGSAGNRHADRRHGPGRPVCGCTGHPPGLPAAPPPGPDSRSLARIVPLSGHTVGCHDTKAPVQSDRGLRYCVTNQALPESFSRRAASWASLASEPPTGSAWPEAACEPLSEE